MLHTVSRNKPRQAAVGILRQEPVSPDANFELVAVIALNRFTHYTIALALVVGGTTGFGDFAPDQDFLAGVRGVAVR